MVLANNHTLSGSRNRPFLKLFNTCDCLRDQMRLELSQAQMYRKHGRCRCAARFPRGVILIQALLLVAQDSHMEKVRPPANPGTGSRFYERAQGQICAPAMFRRGPTASIPPGRGMERIQIALKICRFIEQISVSIPAEVWTRHLRAGDFRRRGFSSCHPRRSTGAGRNRGRIGRRTNSSRWCRAADLIETRDTRTATRSPMEGSTSGPDGY